MSHSYTSEEALKRLALEQPGCIALLAEFCGVQEHAVVRWFRGEHLPKGLTQIKLRVYLTLSGYRLTEFESLNSIVRNFTKLLAFGVIDAEEARKELALEYMNGVYNVVLRGSSLLPDRRYRLERLVENASVLLPDAELEWQERIQAISAGQAHPRGNPPTQPFDSNDVAIAGLKQVAKQATRPPQAPVLTEPDAHTQSASAPDQLVRPTIRLIEALRALTTSIDDSPNYRDLHRAVSLAVSLDDAVELRDWFAVLVDEFKS